MTHGQLSGDEIGMVSTGQLSIVEIGIVTPGNGANFPNKQTICLTFSS